MSDEMNTKWMIVFPAIRQLGGPYRTLDGSKALMHDTAHYSKIITSDKRMCEQLSPEELDYVINQYMLTSIKQERLSRQVQKLLDIIGG